MTAVLVSGATGLAGRYIVEGLVAGGYRVRAASRTPPARDLFPAAVEHVTMSLEPDRDHAELFAGIDHFVHAAFAHVPGRYRGGEGGDPDGFRRLNLDGTVRLFKAARQAGVRRAVFISSRAVYDGAPPGTALDEARELAPTSLYGEIKLLAEQALAGMSDGRFAGASLRATGIYGGHLPNKWERLFRGYLDGRPVAPRAGGEVHGEDLAAAVRLMLEEEADPIVGPALNVSDIVVDTRDILAPLKEVTASPHPLPEAADKTAVSQMRTERLRALSWRPGGMEKLVSTVRALAGRF